MNKDMFGRWEGGEVEWGFGSDYVFFGYCVNDIGIKVDVYFDEFL